jgi:hypothetical protein
MMKNSSKSTIFNYDSHDCILFGIYICKKRWLAALEGYKESMAGFFHHACPSLTENYG